MAAFTDQQIDALGDIAANTAMCGAADYLRQHGLACNVAALHAALQSECQVALPEAFQDAKDALAVGMVNVAERTFLASMRLAGIRAAKRVAVSEVPSKIPPAYRHYFD